jgi:hypothetical protein
MPAHADDTNPLERWLDLLLQHGSQVERFVAFQSFRRKDEMLWLVVMTLRPPVLQGMFQAWMHRQQFGRSLRFGALEVPTSTPVTIFDTERGFCIDPKLPPFSSFEGWCPEHYNNENLTSVLPWIANMILQAINACNSLMTTFASIIQLPPEIAPGYHVFVRGPHNEALAEVLEIHSGATPWWG